MMTKMNANLDILFKWTAYGCFLSSHQLNHVLLSSGNEGAILLAEILIAASRDFEAFAAVSKLSRDVTTATEVSGIGIISNLC